jgi:hypothetical protein
MSFSSRAYDPEMVSVLEKSLEVAFLIAATHVNGEAEALRRKLASAIMEGANAGMLDTERLVNFALRALPAFRENSLAW